jgi:hypothetical protein
MLIERAYVSSDLHRERLSVDISHLYPGADGLSHFADLELDLRPTPTSIGIDVAAIDLPHVARVQLRELPVGFTSARHTSPCQEFVFQLQGSGETLCSGGQRRIFRAGDLLLGTDTTGAGHCTNREITGPRRQLVIYLDEAFDPQSIRRQR